MKKMRCPQCKTTMEKVRFDVGYGIEIDSLHCKKCGHNVTNEKLMNRALLELRKRMSKEVRIIRVGIGLGVRIPNELAKSFHLQKGKNVLLQPEEDGIRLIVDKN